MGAETVAETGSGTVFAQIALAILGYMVPAAPQWVRAVVAFVVGVLSSLAGELRSGMESIDLLAALTIGGQGLIITAFALGLFAGIGAAQERRADARALPGESDLRRMGG